MKTINTGAILNVLGKSGPMSRIGLTRALGLDGTTITHLVRELLESKLIEPTGYSRPVMGRPKQLLQLNADGRESIGVQIEPHRVSGGLMNMAGCVKSKKILPILASDSQEVVLSKLKTIIGDLANEAVKTRLLGVGIATHGVVDRTTGEILQSARFPVWCGVNIYEFMRSNFKFSFAVEDNSRCKAIAEHWFGVARDIDDFVLLDLGFGIGCSVVNSGKPLTGITNSAGEIGHNVAVADGKSCRCGMKGCLEAVAAIPSIEEAFAERFPECGRLSFAMICELVKEGHRGAVSVVEEAGTHIGVVTSGIINILNPGYLVICGELLEAGEIIESAIRNALELHTIPASFAALQIVRGTATDAAVVGAATLMLDRVFSAAS